jgi:large subunit ribosomal protein L13
MEKLNRLVECRIGSVQVQKTYYPKQDDAVREWYLVDAAGQNLGRLATLIARLLLGKDKPQYTPGVEIGDYVVVINAEKIEVTGKKLDQKVYYRHSGYPGGISRITLRQQKARHPERVIESAVRGMLPRNRLRRKLMGNLRVYAGARHPHAAQKPKPLAMES